MKRMMLVFVTTLAVSACATAPREAAIQTCPDGSVTGVMEPCPAPPPPPALMTCPDGASSERISFVRLPDEPRLFPRHSHDLRSAYAFDPRAVSMDFERARDARVLASQVQRPSASNLRGNTSGACPVSPDLRRTRAGKRESRARDRRSNTRAEAAPFTAGEIDFA